MPMARLIRDVAELPDDYFQVRSLSLANVVGDVGKVTSKCLPLLRFREFDQLEKVDFTGIALDNLSFLEPSQSLQELTLANNGALDDAALAKLPVWPQLQKLVLDGSNLRGSTLAELNRQPRLTDVSLGCATFGDLFAENLAKLHNLKRVSLGGSGVTDDGLLHLSRLTNLERLDLRGTKTSGAAREKLRASLPNCRID
jgi:hypothetical protein